MKKYLLALFVVLLSGTLPVWAQASPQGTVSFAMQNYTVAENAGIAVITVNLVRSNGSEGVLAVQCYTVHGTATPDDYEPVNTAIAFAPGETSKTFTIPIFDDFDDEPNETVLLVLTNATCGAALPGGLSSATATLVIVDNEVNPGELTFSSAYYSHSETDGVATITVTRTRGSSGVVSVQYYTADDTAIAGLDYQGASGTLLFADGETNKTFTVPILDDPLVEADETVYLVLTNATGGARFPADLPLTPVAGLIILDNEPSPGVFTFSASSCSETSGVAAITVTRTRGSSGPVSLQYYTANDTAVAGMDYVAAHGTLVFANGQTSKTFVVPILNDALVESEEMLLLVLTNATGGATLQDGASSLTTTLAIVDDDNTSAPLAITGCERQNDLLRFRFAGEPSYDYFVEFSESCFGNNWLTLTNFHAGNQPIEAVVTDSITSTGSRFYRIRKFPAP